jgi:hypothetical protein
MRAKVPPLASAAGHVLDKCNQFLPCMNLDELKTGLSAVILADAVWRTGQDLGIGGRGK